MIIENRIITKVKKNRRGDIYSIINKQKYKDILERISDLLV